MRQITVVIPVVNALRDICLQTSVLQRKL